MFYKLADAGLSELELALRFEVHPATVTNYLKKKMPPADDTALGALSVGTEGLKHTFPDAEGIGSHTEGDE